MSEPDQARAAYAGLVTRAVAIGIDLLLVNALALLAAGAVSLIASLLGHKDQLNLGEVLAGGVAWFLWVGLYFVLFWTITGQTPGSRILGIRVVSQAGGAVKLRQSVRRFPALVLAALPLGAGFVRVLFDERRRGFHDRVAGTEVRWVYAVPTEPPAVASDPVTRTDPLGQLEPVTQTDPLRVVPGNALIDRTADPAPTRHS